jgi:hypothetical protein
MLTGLILRKSAAVSEAELLQGGVVSRARREREQDDDHRRGCM